MNSLLTNLSAKELRQAASLKERIDRLEHELTQMFGTSVEERTGRPISKRRMSRAARARIAAGARRRWARVKGTTKAGFGKRKMSAAGKARLATIAKESWK